MISDCITDLDMVHEAASAASEMIEEISRLNEKILSNFFLCTKRKGRARCCR